VINLIFQRKTELHGIKINGNSLQFYTPQGNICRYTTIEGLKLNVAGILKEFPDLKGKPVRQIKKIGIQRFQEHIKKLKSENQVKNYLIKDLGKHGYKLKVEHRAGFRPKVHKI
jgi:hypothetical protein